MKRKNSYSVAKAFTLKDGRDIPDGWDLFCLSPGSTKAEWCNRFVFRRDAFNAMRELEGKAKTNV